MSREKVAFFDKLGFKYEQILGENAAQINYVNQSLGLVKKHTPSNSQPASILDIGCGTGKPTRPLVVARGTKFHGIDFSAVMIDIARQQIPEGTFECVSQLDFGPMGKQYDAAFAIFSLFSFTRGEMEEPANQWGKWIKPGGFLFIGTMDVDWFPQGTKFEGRDESAGRAKHRVIGSPICILPVARQQTYNVSGSGISPSKLQCSNSTVIVHKFILTIAASAS